MAESAFLDDGSHLDQNATSADRHRRNETCWLLPAAASRPRTLSLTTVCGLPRLPIRLASSRATRAPDSDVSPIVHFDDSRPVISMAVSFCVSWLGLCQLMRAAGTDSPLRRAAARPPRRPQPAVRTGSPECSGIPHAPALRTARRPRPLPRVSPSPALPPVW